MADADLNVIDPTESSVAPVKRSRSTISFPYNGLKEAESVVRALLDKGGGSGSYNQLAAWLGHDTVNSGGFRQKTGAARIFGLILVKSRVATLTRLGKALLNPEKQAAARVEAFLSVPLYRKIFETYETGLLPADVGLESQMETLGVAPKQTDKARQVMARSAEYAGFFTEGTSRLVRPAVVPLVAPEGDGEEATDDPADGSGDGNGGDGDTTVIKLRGGAGTLSLSVNVDLVALSRVKEDREFVFGLLDQFAAYEQADEPKRIEAPTSVDQATG